jgi:hypothetical protein
VACGAGLLFGVLPLITWLGDSASELPMKFGGRIVLPYAISDHRHGQDRSAAGHAKAFFRLNRSAVATRRSSMRADRAPPISED